MTNPQSGSHFPYPRKPDTFDPSAWDNSPDSYDRDDSSDWVGGSAESSSGPAYYSPHDQPPIGKYDPNAWDNPGAGSYGQNQGYGAPPAGYSQPTPGYGPASYPQRYGQPSIYQPSPQAIQRPKTLGVTSFIIVIASYLVMGITTWTFADIVEFGTATEIQADQLTDGQAYSMMLMMLSVLTMFIGFILSIVALVKRSARAWAGWALGLAFFSPFAWMLLLTFAAYMNL